MKGRRAWLTNADDVEKRYRVDRFVTAVRWMFGETAAAGGIVVALVLIVSVLGNLALGRSATVDFQLVVLVAGWVTAAVMGFTGGDRVVQTEQRWLRTAQEARRSREAHTRMRADE
ncbi:hypothetical protein [Micromonospora sp. CPCC 206061]|uniref:hypothetical protein n=1 Tax=Micromonospora sp. CPCC 206061 TaxID=3122410 RepID=UPI002FF06BEA